jgi:hypothetical protein
VTDAGVIRAELEPEEQLVWSGRPSPRLLEPTELFGRTVRSLDLGTLGGVEIDHHRGGRGTLTFSEARFGLLEGVSVDVNEPTPKPKLEWISNPDGVFEVINAAWKKI